MSTADDAFQKWWTENLVGCDQTLAREIWNAAWRASKAKMWISVQEKLPERGQKILGRSDNGVWTESFDPDEPLGFMTEWKAI